jgi:hypothetical protein
MVLGTMNRVHVGDGILVATPDTTQMEAFLDTWAGGRPSLKDDEAFSSLAESLGDPLAAALMTPDAVWEPAQDELSTFEKPSEWGELHQWEALAVGYGRTSDGERWYRFSVYYEDPKAAEADAQELVKRMQSYAMLDGGMKPFDLECSSLTSQVSEEADGSTLTVQCDLREGKGGFWLILVEMRELLFLTP